MSTIPLKQSRGLALLFHLNSEPWMNKQAYDEPSVMSAFKTLATDDPGAAIALPDSAAAAPSALFAQISARRSCRQFQDRAMSLDTLATLLHRTYGVIGLRGSGVNVAHHRPVPSAGALYPLELYVIIRRVEGVADGVYHYAAWRHQLERVKEGVAVSALLPDLQEQFYLEPANAIVFFTAVFPRTMKKYGPRGYRYVLLEAGHAAQNLCLLAEEQHLATLCMGGFRDSAINELLELNTVQEGAVYAVALGYPGA